MTQQNSWTPTKLVQWVAEDLAARGLPGSVRTEAELLVSHALGVSRLDLYLQFDKPCTAEERAAVRERVIRRRNREPLSYIVQSCGFRKLTLMVGPGVLIPRPETELLVEAALEVLKPGGCRDSIRVLELGTGSAAISLALATERERMTVVGTEISWQALMYASENVKRYQQECQRNSSRIHLVCCDRFEAVLQEPRFDCIISNPPYIPTAVIATLEDEVQVWEPHCALDGGADGLLFYRGLFDDARRLLRPGGCLICEHGFDQRQAILEQAAECQAFNVIDSRPDYAGHDRMLLFRKKGGSPP